jgi:hypothetical protein
MEDVAFQVAASGVRIHQHPARLAYHLGHVLATGTAICRGSVPGFVDGGYSLLLGSSEGRRVVAKEVVPLVMSVRGLAR